MSAKVTSVAEFVIECQMKGIKGFVAINVTQGSLNLIRFTPVKHRNDMHQLALCDLVTDTEGCYSEVVPRTSDPQYHSIYVIKRTGPKDSDIHRLRFEVCDIREMIKRTKQTIKEMNEQIEGYEDFLDTWCDGEEA